MLPQTAQPAEGEGKTSVAHGDRQGSPADPPAGLVGGRRSYLGSSVDSVHTHRRPRKIRRTGRHATPSQVEKVAEKAGKAAPAMAIAGALVAAAPQAHAAVRAPAKAATVTEQVHTDALVRHAARSATRTYTVQSGDTLSGIAQKQCGTAHDWVGLWHANPHITDPNLIYSGNQLTVACSGGQGAVVTATVAPSPPSGGGDQDGDGGSSPASSGSSISSGSNVSSSGGGSYVNPVGYGGFQACVISRESGGNSQVMNSSGHYGLYQFSGSTWAAAGGNPGDFGHASVAEQNQVFAQAYAKFGSSPWAPYDGC